MPPQGPLADGPTGTDDELEREFSGDLIDPDIQILDRGVGRGSPHLMRWSLLPTPFEQIEAKVLLTPQARRRRAGDLHLSPTLGNHGVVSNRAPGAPEEIGEFPMS